MPLDPRVQRFLRLLAVSGPLNEGLASVAARRTSLATLMQLGCWSPAVERIEDHSIPGAAGKMAIRVYSPLGAAGGAELGGLVYFHGGGHVAGNLDTHDSIARELANAGGCRVLSVDYRLAPEFPYPAAVEDAEAAVRYIAAHAPELGVDRHRLGICGDSAGGTLAAVTCLALAGTGLLMLQILICPILDYRRESQSWRDFGRGYMVEDATLAHDLLNYMPAGIEPSDPRISPLLTPHLEGLPRTFIHTAEFDPLRDDGRSYFERLGEAGCRVSYSCHPGMIHLFYGLKAVIPTAAAAFSQIGTEIRSVLGAPRAKSAEQRGEYPGDRR